MEIELADSRDNEKEYESSDIESLDQEIDDGKDEMEEVSGDPKVLILHTHATESYLPVSAGNYHTRNEENTVRDVGNVLTKTLESKGIAVIHDKTLHDDPSYNESYYRSYETAKAILAKYPSIECVIDLHRDAVASKDPAATVSVNGKICAKYSFVVGTTASTYSSNKTFVNKLNGTALNKYKGFTGAVIERGYRYNQDLSSKYLLLEIGFNRNQIEDCRNTAEIFGNILADTLKNS
ncbi:MAG: stage II sporulation protein P [Firmicutes bacterium]|nr:stage II sporulation protein P [Bacillota bacterium]